LAILESLRLHPPIPLDTKFARVDVAFPDGTQVRAGDQCTYPIYAMNRLTTLWGDDASQFRLKRFAAETADSGTTGAHTGSGSSGNFPNPYKFVTFNAGPRICLGRSMAMTEIKMVLCLLLQRFELALVDPNEDIRYLPGIILRKKGPLRVTVRLRKQQ